PAAIQQNCFGFGQLRDCRCSDTIDRPARRFGKRQRCRSAGRDRVHNLYRRRSQSSAERGETTISDISPTSGTAKDPAENSRLLHERFSPMARFGGPLYAGIYSSQGISGSLYVGELNQWLWVPERSGSLDPEDALLSDEQVAAARDLAVTLES